MTLDNDFRRYDGSEYCLVMNIKKEAKASFFNVNTGFTRNLIR